MDIKNSNGWSLITLKNIREIAMLAFFGVLTFKIANMELKLNIAEFGFTDLLSIIVALFSIALSVAFYFKATDTSNRFYDNSYAFTKDISEIIGRMEAGFGERLRHLDEGYTGIRGIFDNIPLDLKSTKENLEREYSEIKLKEEEQRDAFERLAQRAQLAEDEKQDLFQKMQILNQELEVARSAVKLHEAEIELQDSDGGFTIRELKTISKIHSLLIENTNFRNPNLDSTPLLIESFNRIKEFISKSLFDELIRAGFVDLSGNLTRHGANKILNYIRIRVRSASV